MLASPWEPLGSPKGPFLENPTYQCQIASILETYGYQNCFLFVVIAMIIVVFVVSILICSSDGVFCRTAPHSSDTYVFFLCIVLPR